MCDLTHDLIKRFQDWRTFAHHQIELDEPDYFTITHTYGVDVPLLWIMPYHSDVRIGDPIRARIPYLRIFKNDSRHIIEYSGLDGSPAYPLPFIADEIEHHCHTQDGSVGCKDLVYLTASSTITAGQHCVIQMRERMPWPKAKVKANVKYNPISISSKTVLNCTLPIYDAKETKIVVSTPKDVSKLKRTKIHNLCSKGTSELEKAITGSDTKTFVFETTVGDQPSNMLFETKVVRVANPTLYFLTVLHIVVFTFALGIANFYNSIAKTYDFWDIAPLALSIFLIPLVPTTRHIMSKPATPLDIRYRHLDTLGLSFLTFAGLLGAIIAFAIEGLLF